MFKESRSFQMCWLDFGKALILVFSVLSFAFPYAVILQTLVTNGYFQHPLRIASFRESKLGHGTIQGGICSANTMSAK